MAKVLLTEDDLLAWKTRQTELEGQIGSANAELALIRRKLEAASVLISMTPANLVLNGHASIVDVTPKVGMRATITQAVANSKTPIAKAKMRGMLAEQGFSAERLGAYFYTNVARLKERGAIQVLENGDLASPDYKENAEGLGSHQPARRRARLIDEGPGAQTPSPS